MKACSKNWIKEDMLVQIIHNFAKQENICDYYYYSIIDLLVILNNNYNVITSTEEIVNSVEDEE